MSTIHSSVYGGGHWPQDWRGKSITSQIQRLTRRWRIRRAPLADGVNDRRELLYRFIYLTNGLTATAWIIWRVFSSCTCINNDFQNIILNSYIIWRDYFLRIDIYIHIKFKENYVKTAWYTWILIRPTQKRNLKKIIIQSILLYYRTIRALNLKLVFKKIKEGGCLTCFKTLKEK